MQESDREAKLPERGQLAKGKELRAKREMLRRLWARSSAFGASLFAILCFALCDLRLALCSLRLAISAHLSISL
jgi:hypothetical protein